MNGHYHSIEHFGTVDGPGIRYVLFLSGCQLRCRFCHNPDTWQAGNQTISAQEVLADLLRYRHFYDPSGGGITLSGGEPLLQPEFATELLSLCHTHNIHTTIDTAGYYDQENITRILPYTDLALFSIKAVNPQKHLWLAGSDNTQILSNLHYMTKHIKTILRYVVIPGLTDLPEDLQDLSSLIHSLPKPVPVELLPYHTYGLKKWQDLKMNYTLGNTPEATPQDVAKVAKFLTTQGIKILNQNE